MTVLLWGERSLQFTEKTPTPVRQLPITECAHKAGIVGDPLVRAVLAALDRAHHLQLVEAHMAAVGLAPSGTVAAEDVRDLQSGSSHEPAALLRRRFLDGSSRTFAGRRAPRERALNLGDESCRHAGRIAPSCRPSRARATPESAECPCRSRADGLRRNGAANEERPPCAGPLLSPLP